MTRTVKTTWKNRFAKFLRNSGGNVTLMFGLSAAPLMMVAGAAIEYSSLSGVDATMQGAADSAALAAANAFAANNGNYASVAVDYLRNNAPATIDKASIKTNVKLNQQDQTVSVEWSAKAKLSLGKIFGLREVAIGSKSTVGLPIFSDFQKGEIALVVDYSYSMNSYVDGVRKYVSMRNEAKKLINAITQNGVNTDVKIGIVPFSENVRVSMPKNYFNGQTGTGTWTKCVWDRYYPYNTQATTPGTTNTTKWTYTDNCSGSYSGTPNATVRPLTTAHAGTLSQFNTMVPIGNTHIALGMEMAYHMMTPNAPLTEAVDHGTKDTLKAVVLLTDGEQTTEGYGPSGALSVANANSNLEALCTSMKTAGIRIVTVSFDLQDGTYSAAENRLKNCASGPEYYFNTETNAELASAFGTIRSQLARNMYIAK